MITLVSRYWLCLKRLLSDWRALCTNTVDLTQTLLDFNKMKNIFAIFSLTFLLCACGGGDDDKVISGGGQSGVEQYAGRYVGTIGIGGKVSKAFIRINRSGRIITDISDSSISGCTRTEHSGYQVNKKGNFTFASEYRCGNPELGGCSRIGISARGSITRSGYLSAKGTIRFVCSSVGLNSTQSYEIQARRR